MQPDRQRTLVSGLLVIGIGILFGVDSLMVMMFVLVVLMMLCEERRVV